MRESAIISRGKQESKCHRFLHECAIFGTTDGVFSKAKENICLMAAPAECGGHLDPRERSAEKTPTPEVLRNQMAHASASFPVGYWNASAWTAVVLLVFILVQLAAKRWRALMHVSRSEESQRSPAALECSDRSVPTSGGSVSVNRHPTGRVMASSAPALASRHALNRQVRTVSYSTNSRTLGFLAHAARLDQRMVTLGTIIGSGGVANIFALRLVHQDHRRIVQACTRGRGLVVKRLQQAATEWQVESFKREIGILKRIAPHPNVLWVPSTNEIRFTMVMERMDFDLYAFLETPDLLGGIQQHELMRLFGGVVNALTYLHEDVNIVHCDLKPENIFITGGPGPFVFKIADFGFSTDIGTLSVGWTIEYLPPEYMGTAVDIDDNQEPMVEPAFDTFALGVIAHQLLTRSVYPPTSHEMLFMHENVLFPEGLPIRDVFARRRARVRQLEASGDNDQFERESEQLESFYTHYGGQEVRMGDTRNTIFGPTMFQPHENIPYAYDVISVLISLMHEDPSRRIPLRIFRDLLTVAQVWSSNSPRSTNPLPSNAAQILRNATRSLGEGRPSVAWIVECTEREGGVWWRDLRLLDNDS